MIEGRDPELIKEIIELGGHDLLKCYQCGTCIADCPTGFSETPLSAKRLIHIVRLGLREKLLEEETPWMCVTCGGCEERCPRGAEPFEIVLAIRRWQCREDDTFVPLALGEIFARGHTQNVLNPIRKEIGLPEIKTVAKNEEALRKFREVIKETEVYRRYGYIFKEE